MRPAGGRRDEVVAALRALSRHWRTDAPLPEPARELLADGLDAFLSGGAGLEEALGLKPGPGQRAALTMAVLAERDDLLRAAATEFFPELKPAEQARELHERWSRYAAIAWGRERALPEPPAWRAGTIEARFWRIMRVRDNLLAMRSVRAVLAASSGCSLPPPDVTLNADET